MKIKKGCWSCRLQKNYASYEEFESYSNTYGLHYRLGYNTALEAWANNPKIMGSTDPKDFKKVSR